MESTSPPEQPRTGAPFVTAETRDKLLSEFGLIDDQPKEPELTNPTDRLLRDAIDASQHKQAQESYRFTIGMKEHALNIFGDIAENNSNFVIRLREVLKEVDPYNMYLDTYALGMSVVLRAMHVQSDYRLYYKLSQLNEADIDRFSSVIKEGLEYTRPGDSNILDKALSIPRIPQSQENLRELVERVDKYHSLDTRYKYGASVVYKAIDGIWPSLGMNGENHQSPPPEIPTVTPPEPHNPNPTDQ